MMRSLGRGVFVSAGASDGCASLDRDALLDAFDQIGQCGRSQARNAALHDRGVRRFGADAGEQFPVRTEDVDVSASSEHPLALTGWAMVVREIAERENVWHGGLVQRRRGRFISARGRIALAITSEFGPFRATHDDRDSSVSVPYGGILACALKLQAAIPDDRLASRAKPRAVCDILNLMRRCRDSQPRRRRYALVGVEYFRSVRASSEKQQLPGENHMIVAGAARCAQIPSLRRLRRMPGRLGRGMSSMAESKSTLSLAAG